MTDLTKLLTTFECNCGKTHSCETESVIIEKNAVSKIGELASKYNRVILAGDINIFPLCGDRIREILKDRYENSVIFESASLVPNEEALGLFEKGISEKTDLIIGIGSGVIQDLCKYVSFNHGIPYFIVATAPSMDGYASIDSALIINNMKVSYPCRAPKAIIGDTDILKNSPIEMIQSGYGDILGKFSSLADWLLAKTVNGEYYCPYVAEITLQMLNDVKGLGQLLLLRDEYAIEALMTALVGVGIAMAYVGNSRPASGSEHHMSHFFEVMGLLKDEFRFVHGTDVAFSAYYTQKLREKLLKLDAPPNLPAHTKEAAYSDIEKIYGVLSKEIILLQESENSYGTYLSDIYSKKWSHIKQVLSITPSSEKMEEYLESIGLFIEDFDSTYGKDKIETAMKYAKDLKNRYTLLWLYYYCF